MNKFVTAQGWYEPDSPRPQTLRNLAVSLSLESAEVLEHFQWKEEEENKEKLGQELADVALYLLQIASIAEIDLEKAGRTTLLKIIACTTRRMARAAEMNPDIKRLLSFGIWCFLLGACIGITVVTVLVGKGQQINWGSAPGILVSGLATAYAFYRKLGTEPGPLARKIQRDMHKKNVNEVGVTLQER